MSILRELVRRLPIQELGKRPLPKGFVADMLRDPEYKPVPPEACECGIISKDMRSVTWRKCTLLGELDGRLPDQHVRMGTGDYLTGTIAMRMCRRVR